MLVYQPVPGNLPGPRRRLDPSNYHNISINPFPKIIWSYMCLLSMSVPLQQDSTRKYSLEGQFIPSKCDYAYDSKLQGLSCWLNTREKIINLLKSRSVLVKLVVRKAAHSCMCTLKNHFVYDPVRPHCQVKE